MSPVVYTLDDWARYALATIYRKAARLIELNRNDTQGCCAAIWRAQGEPECGFGRDYETLAHKIFGHYIHWGSGLERFGERHADGFWDGGTPEADDHRILVLCTLAAMAEAGDLNADAGRLAK